MYIYIGGDNMVNLGGGGSPWLYMLKKPWFEEFEPFDTINVCKV